MAMTEKVFGIDYSFLDCRSFKEQRLGYGDGRELHLSRYVNSYCRKHPDASEEEAIANYGKNADPKIDRRYQLAWKYARATAPVADKLFKLAIICSLLYLI